MSKLVRGALFLMGLALALPAAAQSRGQVVEALNNGDYATAEHMSSAICDSVGDSELCWLAFEFLTQKSDWDRQRGFELLTRACNGWDGYCSNAGNIYSEGVLVPQDHKIALDFFRKGCDKGGLAQCGEMGRRWSIGLATEDDYRKAWNVLWRECDVATREPLIAGYACMNFASLLELTSQVRQTPSDETTFGQIESTLTKGCKRHRYAVACQRAAELVLQRLDATNAQASNFQAMATRVREHLDLAAEFAPLLPGGDLERVRATLPLLNRQLENKLAGRN
jgi:TPR repeat protein